MKKVITFLTIILMSSSTTANAFYQPFWPEERTFELSVPEVVFTFENGKQTTILQPTFRGTADSFALVTVVPNMPTVAELPATVVENLQTLTSPLQAVISNVNISYTTTDGEEELAILPVVSDPEYHDDYEVTVIPTTDPEALTAWLDEYGYSYQPEAITALSAYQDFGGYSFVVVHVAVAETAQYNDEGFFGTLSLITLTFDHMTPYLPLPVMNTKAEMDPINLDIYTVSPEYFYIPGVNTVYSKKVDAEDTGLSFTEQPWLVRQELSIDPSSSTQDLYLNRDAEGYTISRGSYSTRTINPEFLRTQTGIQPGTAPSTDEVVATFENLTEGTRLLTYGVRGEDVKELQRFLNRELSLQLVTDGVWGTLTHEAVQLFQSQHELTVDGIIGNQTRSYIAGIIGE